MSLLRKDVARVVRLKEFHSRVEQVLPQADRDYFFYALKEYNTYKSVAKLMLALNSCLDTPEKLDLLPSIRSLIPKHDRRKFDNLAPYNRMAHPPSSSSDPPSSPPPTLPQQPSRVNSDDRERVKWKEGGEEEIERLHEEETSPVVKRKKAKVRAVFLERQRGQSWGFSIRGGRDRDVEGIFVSVVDPFSLAEKSGLKQGDQILTVNGYSFRDITHQSAALILKTHDQLQMSLSSGGHIPSQKQERKSLIWVDTSGNPIDDKGAVKTVEEDQREGDRLLESSDKHKVILMVENEQPLGFSLRGGREFSLGIFVSQVDEGSPAEQSGLKVGDQILGVNGHSFSSMLHQEAVSVLKAYNTLVLTVRSLGRLPQLVVDEREEQTLASPPQPTPPPPHTLPHLSRSLENHTHQETPTFHTASNSDHTQLDQHDGGVIRRNKRWSDWRKSASRRSQSVREFFRPRSLYATPPQHRRHDNAQPSRSHSYRQQLAVPVQHSPPHDLSPSSRLRAGSDGALVHRLKAPVTSNSPSPDPRSRSLHERSVPPVVSPLTVSSGTTPTNQTQTKVDQTRPRSQSNTTPNGRIDGKVVNGGVRGGETVGNGEGGGGGGGGGGVGRGGEGGGGRGESGGVGGGGGGGGGGGVEKQFFRYGVGTQLMLAAVSSSARALLEDSARRCLDEDEMEALTHRLREYEMNGGVKSFAEFLVSLLDTPRKMQLLSDIRSILHPTDLVTFDGIVSPHEIAALQKRASSLLGNKKTTPTTRATPPTQTVNNSVGSEGTRKTGQERRRRHGSGENELQLRSDRLSERERDGRREGEDDGRREQNNGEGDKNERRETEEQQPNEKDKEEQEQEEETEKKEEEENEIEIDRERHEDDPDPEEEEERGGDKVEEEEEEENKVEDKEDVEVEEEEEVVEEEEEEEVVEEEEEGEYREEEEIEPINNPQDNYNLVLYEIQNHGGQGSLRRAEVKDGDIGSPHIGAFGSQPANQLLTKASEEEPSMIGMQTRESFLEWNEDYDSLERTQDKKSPGKNPVLVEIAKSAPQLGLTITGGVDTPSRGVIITEVKQGGAAGIDGFLQAGFEIVQADGVRIRGLTHDVAAQTLARAFRSDRPTIELIVIPN